MKKIRCNMRALTLVLVVTAFFLTGSVAKAQEVFTLTDLQIKVDTSSYTLKKNTVSYQGQKQLAITVDDNKEVCEVTVIFGGDRPVEMAVIPEGPGYTVIDSLRKTEMSQWKGLIRFDNLIYAPNPVLTIQAVAGGDKENFTVKILPVVQTKLEYHDEIHEVLQEEEKTIEIPAKDAFNIITDNIWYVSEDYDYRVSQSTGVLTVTVKPHTLGYKELAVNLRTIKPVWNVHGQLTQQLPPVRIKFSARPNQLYFLNADKTVIYADPNFRGSEEIFMDYNKNMSLKKTYRIEDQPEENGSLIAELTPISVIENNSRILCRIRPYSLHRMSDGYLYIKENNRPRFITNFNIWEKPRINAIYLRHEGGDWISSNSVFPGEELEVRLEGKGLENARIQFGGIHQAERDSLRISEDAVYYRLKIPVTISSRSIPLIVNKIPSAFELYVREYQKPAELDFVSVDYGKGSLPLTSEKLDKPILFEETLDEINFTFRPTKIDENEQLYGKQYLTINIKIFNRKNDLIEIQQIENIVVCPGENSPRKLFYDSKDCSRDGLTLNDYLVHKTYQLDPFSQIEITVAHNENKYGGAKGYSQKLKIILTRRVLFDVQVTFPTGLLVKKFKESGYGNLTGISTSILAQFNFYNPRQIGKLRPYSIGAGFIALNAFNFSTSANNLRDVGIVVLGSITPVRREAKFSLPIYAGGGYLLKANSWFLVFGPGIQLNF